MKVTFEFTEEIWSIGPFTLEIPDNELLEYSPNINLENTEDCEQEINNYIFSNYSIQDLIKMGAHWDCNTELTITEINANERKLTHSAVEPRFFPAQFECAFFNFFWSHFFDCRRFLSFLSTSDF